MVGIIAFVFSINNKANKKKRNKLKKEAEYRQRLSSLLAEAKRTGEVVIAECFYCTYAISDSNYYVKSYFKVNGKEYRFNKKQWLIAKKALKAQGINVKEYSNLQLRAITDNKKRIVETQKSLRSE